MTDMPPPIAYATPVATDIDIEHLRLLSVFHWIVGGIQALFGCFPIIHLVLGIMLLLGKFPDQSNNPPPSFLGWFFVGIAGSIMLIAWTIAGLTIYSGFQIRRHRRRTFSIIVAAVNCIHFPFGTVLGVFTLIVLLRRSVEDLYRSTAARI